MADLFASHALPPRKWGDQVLAHGHNDFPDFAEWWEPLYDEDVAPEIAWPSTAT